MKKKHKKQNVLLDLLAIIIVTSPLSIVIGLFIQQFGLIKVLEFISEGVILFAGAMGLLFLMILGLGIYFWATNHLNLTEGG